VRHIVALSVVFIALLGVTATPQDKIGDTDLDACQVDAVGAMLSFQDEYRRRVDEEVADIRFVPIGSARAMTYVDPRTGRLTVMVNVAAMTRMCPETTLLMARHEACHARLDADRLRDQRPIDPTERMHMEMRAGLCALESQTP